MSIKLRIGGLYKTAGGTVVEITTSSGDYIGDFEGRVRRPGEIPVNSDNVRGWWCVDGRFPSAPPECMAAHRIVKEITP